MFYLKRCEFEFFLFFLHSNNHITKHTKHSFMIFLWKLWRVTTEDTVYFYNHCNYCRLGGILTVKHNSAPMCRSVLVNKDMMKMSPMKNMIVYDLHDSAHAHVRGGHVHVLSICAYELYAFAVYVGTALWSTWVIFKCALWIHLTCCDLNLL